MGRKTWEAARKQGGYGMPGVKAYVFSGSGTVLLHYARATRKPRRS